MEWPSIPMLSRESHQSYKYIVQEFQDLCIETVKGSDQVTTRGRGSRFTNWREQENKMEKIFFMISQL